MSDPTVRMEMDEVEKLVFDACFSAGASLDTCHSLVRAILSAEGSGNKAVGLDHLPDYLMALREGRLNGYAQPELSFPAPALLQVDARGGIAQLGFDRAFDELTTRAATFGIALLSLHGAFSAGELGYYPLRLAKAGFAAFAAANGAGLMTAGSARGPVFGANPIAFAAPRGSGPPLLIDQASSRTSPVSVRRAAERGEALPPGWAVDADGKPTTDAAKALKGALLAFGGNRGANIALMVEVMAAGLGKANWSADVESQVQGSARPAVGMIVIAITPALLDQDFAPRLDRHLRRLASNGLHIPGEAKGNAARAASRSGINIAPETIARIVAAAGS
ncbi:Ldh family oxidoreductase [Rhizobium sp. RU36D]|uniref:Ldh family oxidoreductase n=1 Tax=Rhizobium sp. RU36D TaxID=1907415 RepID=UPI0009D85F58|nr:Ldh family oxidoreductase [Rhizobium sp. RU36D]SMD03280.1 (2R)-3-sulfolactate dehydrogenase (NADP+) [Rhizobium sp. RU36D]